MSTTRTALTIALFGAAIAVFAGCIVTPYEGPGHAPLVAPEPPPPPDEEPSLKPAARSSAEQQLAPEAPPPDDAGTPGAAPAEETPTPSE